MKPAVTQELAIKESARQAPMGNEQKSATRPRAEQGAPLPREHGAWGLLLQPFLAAAILTGFWSWTLIPVLALVVLGFMLKEPLVVLARQRWVWRTYNPQSRVAKRWLAFELAGIGICIAALLQRTPPVPFAALAAGALALTIIAVWFTVNNKQRSVTLQALSAAGLSTSALLVALMATQTIPVWAWKLWVLLTLHATGSILLVHARLRLKIAKKTATSTPRGGRPRLAAVLAQLAQVAVAATFIVAGMQTLALPLVLSALYGVVELYRLDLPGVRDEALKRVGYRALGASIVHGALTVALLWSESRVV